MRRRSDALRQQLQGEWVHSFEEDGPDTLVFRRGDFPFPPARRPRRALRLLAEGDLRVGTPGPADRPVWTPGRWAFVQGRLRLEATGHDDSFAIVALEPDRLEVARRDQPEPKDGP